MSNFKYYSNYVEEESNQVVEESKVDLKDELEKGSVNLDDYFDDIIFEHVDSEFIYHDLMDSANILEQSDNVETDSGLWEGEEPVKAVQTQAFFTLRNDLSIRVIAHAVDMLEEYSEEIQEQIEGIENDMEDLKEEATLAGEGKTRDDVDELWLEHIDLEEERDGLADVVSNIDITLNLAL